MVYKVEYFFKCTTFHPTVNFIIDMLLCYVATTGRIPVNVVNTHLFTSMHNMQLLRPYQWYTTDSYNNFKWTETVKQ